VGHLLQPGTRRTQDVFARCARCGGVYWRGAHSVRLEAVVNAALAVVGGGHLSPPNRGQDDTYRHDRYAGRWIMSISDRWSMLLSIQESDGETMAMARLALDDGEHVAGHGKARLNPTDQGVEKIGAEIAVARALSDLAHKLLHAAALDVEGMTHQHAHLHL
jgi:hypothetical protein